MKPKVLTSILLTLVTAGYSQVPDTAKLDQFFDRLAEKNKAMGTVFVAKEGKEIYARTIGYGEVNETKKKPLTAASRFRIGSITKMFTAAMVLQLTEEKKLKLTDTLDKFFPQIPNSEKITVLQILGHRSGIHDSLIDPNLRTSPRTEPATTDQLLSLVAKGKPDFEPGTQHRYSNSGYFLLGLIIEKVTGKPYAANLKERITSKIDLNDTYPATGNIDVKKNEALTYMNLGGEWKPVPETHPSNLYGSGFIISTPRDLAIFVQSLFDLKLISGESLALMKTMREGEGIGMEPFTFGGKTFYGHTGGADNYGAWLAYLPEEKLAIAYTTNAKVYPVKNIVSGVVDIYYNKPFDIPLLESVAVSTEVLDKYIGVYSSPDAPAKFTITRKDSTLFFQPPGAGSPVALEALSENRFQIEGAVVIEFDTANNRMTVKRRGGERVFTKEK